MLLLGSSLNPPGPAPLHLGDLAVPFGVQTAPGMDNVVRKHGIASNQIRCEASSSIVTEPPISLAELLLFLMNGSSGGEGGVGKGTVLGRKRRSSSGDLIHGWGGGRTAPASSPLLHLPSGPDRTWHTDEAGSPPQTKRLYPKTRGNISGTDKPPGLVWGRVGKRDLP